MSDINATRLPHPFPLGLQPCAGDVDNLTLTKGEG
uniref:MSDIN-like toxin proprotein 12 n=1 Tax=Amanita bisporigera TaxID=87325 RepID=MSD12_AMABI|nr:RecName: Full=MSDIN-like toxin proprotein 12; Contains: RecName: Full=Toxin MSD12; Flags: Precursor [Amanita bisporigera]ABW87784.1 putative MSDIN-like protein 12 [Amanita bisporigera]